MVRPRTLQKMIEMSLWSLWSLLIGSAVLWLLYGAAAYWGDRGVELPDVAGWIQAFGSIGAILAAAYIASEDRRSERLRDKKKEAVICLALLYQAEEAKAVLWARSITFKHQYDATMEIPKSMIDSVVSNLDGQIQAMQAIDLYALPDPRLVNIVVAITAHLDDARYITMEALDEFIRIHSQHGPFKEHVDDVIQLIEEIRQFTDSWISGGV